MISRISIFRPGNQTISLLADGVVIPTATFTLANGTLANGTNQDYSVSFTANGAYAALATESLTIQLSDNAFGVGRPVQAAFDDVRLEETPEPATWVMVSLGAVLLGGFGLRRLHA